MLACARSSATRVATRASSRRFATAVDAAGIRVAAVDQGQASTSVTVLVKAGTRYETKPGVASLLKNFAFKSTNDKSSLRIARESEFYGGVLSASLGREHLALTAEFLKGDEAYFVNLLSSLLTQARFARHELNENVLPATEAEFQDASSNPAVAALDAAHTLAFRKGLGASLYANPAQAHHLTEEDVKSFASNVFKKDNIAVFGTGIDSSYLSKLVEKSLASLPSGSTPSSIKGSTYFGGESRIPVAPSHGDGPKPLQTVFVGFGTTNPSHFELSVLKALLSPASSIKWSKFTSTSPLFENLPSEATIEPVLLPYSDAALFGLLIQAPSAKAVQEAGAVAVNALKAATQGSSLKAEDVKKAVNKAKFELASSLENRDGLLNTLSPQLLSGNLTTLESTFSAFDKIDASAVAKTAAELTKSKPVYVAVGDIHSLPYADELGL